MDSCLRQIKPILSLKAEYMFRIVLLVCVSLAFRTLVSAQPNVQLPKQPAEKSKSSLTCEETPLLKAIKRKDASEVRRILQSKVESLDAVSCPEGRTALAESIARGQSEIAKDLLAFGADPNLSDPTGYSPLAYAAFYCEEEVASVLLRKRASVNAVSADGSSALIAASGCRDGRIVAMLLRSGANPNTRQQDGQSALIFAAFSGNVEAVQELVAAGADLNAKTLAGETAISLARQRAENHEASYDKIVSFLSNVTATSETRTDSPK